MRRRQLGRGETIVFALLIGAGVVLLAVTGSGWAALAVAAVGARGSSHNLPAVMLVLRGRRRQRARGLLQRQPDPMRLPHNPYLLPVIQEMAPALGAGHSLHPVKVQGFGRSLRRAPRAAYSRPSVAKRSCPASLIRQSDPVRE